MPRVLLFLFLLSGFFASATPAGKPFLLRVEHLTNPTAIDTDLPRFSWMLDDTRRGAAQLAYQLEVAENMADLGKGTMTWNSGKAAGSATHLVAYAGPPLVPGKKYFWRVRTWDHQGKPTAWSDPAHWRQGLPEAQWGARWIEDPRPQPTNEADFYLDRPNPLFRKTFAISKPATGWRLYICGLGYYEASLDGQKISDHKLDPGWTPYAKRSLYVVHESESALAAGEHAIGVMLGNGWYNPLPLHLFGRWNLREILAIGVPTLLARLEIDHADGTQTVIISDESWKMGEGPVVRNNVYLGETYDARREQTGWDTPGFNDRAWQPAKPGKGPGGALTPQMQPPIRVTRVLPAKSISQPVSGIQVVDFGQNFAGVVRMRVQGPAGTVIRLRAGELLFPDGRVNGLTTVACQIKEMWNLKGGPGSPPTAYQEDSYVLKGEGIEVFEPRFTFHGFRYVEVQGYPGTPQLTDFEGLRMNADLPDGGDFSCSDTLLNRIQEMVEWTFLSNVFSIQSDCPGREKFGYGADIVVTAESYDYNYDMSQFYRKVVKDFADDVRPLGGMPECAPNNDIATASLGDGSGPIGWQLAFPFLLEQQYQFHGDRELLEQQYPVLRKQVEYLRTVAHDHFIEICIGDHEAIDPKPIPLTSTAFYYHHVVILARIATILGYAEDARTYQLLAGEIKKAFIGRFVNPETGGARDSSSQITQTFFLWYDLLPEGTQAKALHELERQVQEVRQGKLATGIFSTKMMFDVFSRYDRNDLAFQVACQDSFPGWVWMLRNGATTLWENWESGDNAPSHNHPMFGSITEWYYRSLAGIQPQKDANGFDRMVLRPLPVPQIDWVKAEKRTPHGTVSSAWKRESGVWNWDLDLPPNTRSEVWIPLSAAEKGRISEGGAIWWENGVPASAGKKAFLRNEGKFAVFEAGGGIYHWSVTGGR